MRGAVSDHYGPPDVVHVEDVAQPQPKADEILIRVRAAAINRTDVQQSDFTQNRDRYDVIFDAVGKLSFARCRAALKQGGRYVPTDGVTNMLLAVSHVPVRGRRAVMALPPRYRKVDVLFLKQLIDAGRYRPVVDRVYALDDIIEAHRYVDTGQKRGNVVISVAAHAVS